MLTNTFAVIISGLSLPHDLIHRTFECNPSCLVLPATNGALFS